jgi:hypothetical protein
MNDDELEQSNGSPSSYGDSSSDDCPVSPNSSWLNNPNPENFPNGTTLPSNDAWYSSESESLFGFGDNPDNIPIGSTLPSIDAWYSSESGSGSSFGFGDYPDVQISADCGGFNPL